MKLKIDTSGTCTNCNSTDSSHWCYAKDLLHQTTDQQFEYMKCNQCKTIYLKNRVSESDLHYIYPEGYAPYGGGNILADLSKVSAFNVTKLRFKIHKMLIKFFEKFRLLVDNRDEIARRSFPKADGVLLDFGCGSNAYLDQAREANWETIGMDFNKQVIDAIIANNHNGIVYESEESWNQIPDGSLSFIRMNHVLEHLYHPQKVLKKLYEKLCIGGVLHIAIPNPDGISAKKFKNQWIGLDCPRHVVLYSSKVLNDLLYNVIGFAQVDELYESTPKDYVRSLGFKAFEENQIEHQLIKKLIHHQRLITTNELRLRWAAKRKRSDRFHLYCTK